MGTVSHVTIRKRVTLFFLFVSLIMFGLIGRLIYLQLYKSSWLAENAVDQRVREIPVEAKRGIIYDRNGKPMALSVTSESVYAIPAEIQHPNETAAKLAAILALDKDKLTEKLTRRQAFIWIKRKVDEQTARTVRDLNLPGIGLTQENKRSYPNGSLASHVLGFTGIDSQGLDGIELTFDSYLKGRQGSIVVEYDARGREIPQAKHRFVAPADGNNVYLTIDSIIQEIVERELEKVMLDTQAKGASIIVLNPCTGEILALANKPDYDPNRFSEYSPKFWRNQAVSNSYEPGSTFKIITAAAAMSQNIVKATDRFYDPGQIEVQGRNIHCWKHGGHGSQNFVEVMQNSCNVGLVNIGLRLGRDNFYNYIDGFGFGKLTGIDLPGEAKGIIIARDKVKPINIATMSIGQSIAVTPIQLLTAVSAVANEGKLLRPQLVREVKSMSGEVVRSFQPDVINEVMSASIARELRGILENVVEKGTGKNAYLEGFHIAGKTGTAQKVAGGGYSPDKYVASFVGFAPADNPQAAVLVVIDEPVGLYYGGQIAAPVFANVMRDIMQYLKIAPQLKNDQDEQKSHLSVPNVINLSTEEALLKLKKIGLNARLEEWGSRVADQIPKPGNRVPYGSSVLLYTTMTRLEAGKITVPDIAGLDFDSARERLGEVGLAIEPVLQGTKAVKQDPLPGVKVQPGTSVMVYFE